MISLLKSISLSKEVCVLIELSFFTVYFIVAVEFPFDLLITLLDKMAEIEFRLCAGANENIQLTALISAFQATKDISPPE